MSSTQSKNERKSIEAAKGWGPFTCYEPKKTARTHYLKIYVEKEERSIDAAMVGGAHIAAFSLLMSLKRLIKNVCCAKIE